MTKTWTPEIRNGLISVPCALYRGGTSKGPVFLASDLPDDTALRDRLLLAGLDTPHWRQIDGIGGSETTACKVVVVSPSQRPDADVDYKFIQLVPNSTYVGDTGTCGNMSTVVGPFALDMGLVEALSDETEVRIYAVNTQEIITARVRSPGRQITYAGDTAIDGVNGTAAPVGLTFHSPFGRYTGALLPSGNRRDVVDGISVTLLDAGCFVMIFRADAVGKTGYETKRELDADKDFVAKIEAIRCAATRLAGLRETDDSYDKPKPIMVAPPRQGGSISSRDMWTRADLPHHCHPAHSGTGSVALAMASTLPDTVASEVADLRPSGDTTRVTIEHPSGQMTVSVEAAGSNLEDGPTSVSLERTCRKLFSGQVYVSERVLRPNS